MTATTDTRAHANRRESMRDAGLTQQEIRTLEGLSHGLTNVQIGAALFLTEHTVKNHVSTLLRKLHANDRTHAVAIGFRKGWLV